MAEIEIKEISLIIKDKKILDNVTIEIEKGTVCGLVGDNGSGKTMLMKCICGFVRPKQGEI